MSTTIMQSLTCIYRVQENLNLKVFATYRYSARRPNSNTDHYVRLTFSMRVNDSVHVLDDTYSSPLCEPLLSPAT